MSGSSRKFILLIALLCFSNATRANVWDQLRNSVNNKSRLLNYQEIRQHMNLLMPPKATLVMGNGNIVLGGGFIVITKESIKSFKNNNDEDPEFEYKFSEHVPQGTSNATRKDLQGIRIMLDVASVNQYFSNTTIGEMSYEDFVEQLRKTLASALSEKGADISYLRPDTALNAANLDAINDNPPHIVMSPQFNADNQDDMVTFCGGNIGVQELKHETNRARLVEALLTGKHINSVRLGACVTEQCKEEFGVQPLSWKKASFEGNARPISAEIFADDINLETEQEHFNGIMTRNLAHNRIFAQAVVIPFPDMQWVRNQIKSGNEMSWIERYAQTLSNAVMRYVSEHASEL